MELESIEECCTATYVNQFPHFKKWDKADQLDFLKNDDQLDTIADPNRGQALIFTIVTEEQNKGESLEALGFTKAASSPKTYSKCRHKDTGALETWVSQPWIIKEKRADLIKQIEEENKPSKEEVERRQTFPEFRLVDFKKTEIFKAWNETLRFPITGTLYRDTAFPAAVGWRRDFAKTISELTGGFDLLKQRQIPWAGITFGDVKDLAVKYRRGEI